VVPSLDHIQQYTRIRVQLVFLSDGGLRKLFLDAFKTEDNK